jgi:DnaJ-class molecular chaperone
LFIQIKTDVPKRLSEKQKQALADFAGLERGKKGWF